MRYPIVIEPGDGSHAYGVIVPDMPGCFSAGDTLDEAIANASEAILLHIEGLLEAGQSVPAASPIEQHRNNPDYKNMLWAIASVDMAKIDERSKRINITMPERIVAMVDTAAKQAGESRSGFLARAAMERLAH